MTTKVLSGAYPDGYWVATNVAGVKVATTGVVNGAGLHASTGLTLTNSGSIADTARGTPVQGYSPGYPGYNGVSLGGVSRVINDNTIIGGAGGPGAGGDIDSTGQAYGGGGGGIGVDLDGGGTLTNKGLVEGGGGGEGSSPGESGGAAYGGMGGVGVSLAAAGSVVNTGTIRGGAGGLGGPTFERNQSSGWGGNGGVGVYLEAAATATNLGSIYGGAGGAAGHVYGKGNLTGDPGTAGDAVIVTAGGVITNGNSTHAEALISGSIGVDVTGAAAVTVTNFGTIRGTAAAVKFDSSADHLIAMNGAEFVGGMDGGGGILELHAATASVSNIGSSGGVLSGGIQGEFFAFATYEFDSGGQWSLGDVNLAAGQVARNAGSLTLTGTVMLASGGVMQESGGKAVWDGAGVTVSNAGRIQAISGVIEIDDSVDNTGDLIADGGAIRLGKGVDVTNSGHIEASAGLVAISDDVDNTGKLIANGGDLTITGDITGAGSAQIAGGALQVDGAFAQNVAFTGASPSGTLVLKDAIAYGGRVSGFSADGQTALDLLDVGFVSASEATFAGSASSGVLTVSDGTHTAEIKLLGDYLDDTFTAQSDGSGGVIVTASGPSNAAIVTRFVQTLANFSAGSGASVATPAQPEAASARPLLAPPHA